jgi:hypothetical protein
MKLIITLSSLLLLVACDRPTAYSTDEPLAQPSFSGAPPEVPIFIQFDNPCSGLPITVTITGRARVINDGSVVHLQRTITTSDGFKGRGTETDVDNGHIFKFTVNDMLTNDSGDRIRAHLVLVLDLSTTPPTVRVMKGTFRGTICVGA